MNPDDYRYTTGYKTWTLELDSAKIIFKVYSYGTVEIRYYTDGVEDTKSICQCDKNTARKYWHTYIQAGFEQTHVCVVHDMKEFHNKKRKREKEKYANILQEAKKAYEDDWKTYAKYEKKLDRFSNYALEA